MVKSKVNDLQGILSKSLGDDFEIIGQQSTLLTEPGEHYGSVMLALNVTVKKNSGEVKDLHLVAKLIPANEMLRLAFDTQVTFKKEVFAYVDTIPALNQLQEEHGVPKEELYENLFPKCLGARLSLEPDSEVDEDSVLIFENLKVVGFKTEDRLRGFDLQTTKVILQDLAKFHAVPLALKTLKPDVFETKVSPGLVQNKGLEQLPKEVGDAFHNSIMEGVKASEELKPYWDKLQEIVDYTAAHPYVERPKPKEMWGSISHSDFWVSNTMVLKNNEGITTENKIVDLQLTSYSTVVRDLLFFLFTSVINEVLDANYEELIRLYFDSFLANLKRFDLDLSAYTWEAFLKELNETAPEEIYHILVMLKPICTERGKVQNSSEDFQDSDWSRKDLLGPAHRSKIKATVLSMAKRNWI